MTDRTLNPNNGTASTDGADADKTIVIPMAPAAMSAGGDNDRTIVYNGTPASAPQAAETTLKTLRPDSAMQTMQQNDRQNDCFVLKGEEYRMVKCLSDNSGEAQVFLVEHEGSEYVLKVYYPNIDVNKKLLQVIRSFNFEMVYHLIDYGKTYVDAKNRSYELMEYLRGGTLQEYSLKQDINQFRRLALQAAAALAYCHEKKVLHKDIKPSNYFFRDPEKTQLVLGDFGISSLLEQNGRSHKTTQARTPIYAAPEMYADVIDGEVEITPAADYYSLGITLFTLWLGENPLSANERTIMRQKNEGRLPRINELPDTVKLIVQGLTTVNPTKRWGYKEVEKWFLGEEVAVDLSSPFLRYKTFVVDPDHNLVADNVHELVPLLIEHDRLGINYLYNDSIASWLEQCGNSKLAAVVRDITTNRYPADQKAGLWACAFAMEPTMPYTDNHGMPCDDMHSLALSLLTSKDQYALTLQNPNDPLFLYLESHTKKDVARLRSYFKPGADPNVAIMRLVYEIDDETPFLSGQPSATVKEIVYAFGHAELSDDSWHALCDGRLLAWMYCHEDMILCESLRTLTKGQPYSKSLAYKVLYNMDRSAAYDLREASTPEDVGYLLAQQLMQTEHMAADDFSHHMSEYTDPQGRFFYFAQQHGWTSLIAEATRCFDMNSEENRERLGAYDLRTALYRYCRILGQTPHYLLADGTELTDGRQLDQHEAAMLRSELRSGALMQWMAAFYHEDPTRDFSEQYSYERELEEWLMAIGRIDPTQPYYRRFTKAHEDTKARMTDVRKQWTRARGKEKAWRYAFYAATALWALLLVALGISDNSFVMRHTFLTILLPVGGMTAVIVATRAYFKGYGPTMSALWGALGYLTAYAPLFILNYVDKAKPALFIPVILLLTAVYALICHFTDFRREQQTDAGFVDDILKNNDVKTELIEPLYYTFRTKSARYKSTKFSLLDDINNQVRSFSGESIIHYMLWTLLMLLLAAEMVLYSPKLLDRRDMLPGEYAAATTDTGSDTDTDIQQTEDDEE